MVKTTTITRELGTIRLAGFILLWKAIVCEVSTNYVDDRSCDRPFFDPSRPCVIHVQDRRGA